jgi:hypothetical protein
MPYQIKKTGKKFQVIKISDGKVMGTHPSRTAARAQLRALYVNEADKSGAMTRDDVMSLLQELHDITCELGAACSISEEDASAEDETLTEPETPAEDTGEPSAEVGSEAYAAGTTKPEQARASREQMNAQYQEQQTRVNESAPGTEPRPGYSGGVEAEAEPPKPLKAQTYPNEHAARIAEPGEFESETFRRKEIAPGVSLVMGKRKKGGAMETQAYRFSAEKFTADEARAWLKDHKISGASFSAATEDKGAAGILSVSYLKSLHVPDAEQFFKDVVAVKAMGKDTIKGYLALWGDPDTVDIEAEFFTGAKSPIGSTDFWDKSLALPRPLTWSHAQDAATKNSVQIGTLVEYGDDDIGRWYTAQLDLAHRYRKAIDRLISQRAVGTSSDSAPQYVIRQPMGKGAIWLKQWPLFAAALTMTPCEPRQIGSVDYFKSLGIDLGELATSTEAGRTEQARRAELEKRVQSLKQKERELRLFA